MKKRPKKEKIRLNLELPVEVMEKILDIQDASGAASITEVIRRSLDVYAFALDLRNVDRLIIRRKDGSEETLRVL